MTFREKLAQEHPEEVNDRYIGGCFICPCDYGYEKTRSEGLCHAQNGNETICRACWDREIPEDNPSAKDETQEQLDGKNCRDCAFRLRDPDKAPCNECEMGSRWLVPPVNDVDMENFHQKPLTPEEQEEHDREINAEIIRGYCKEYDTKPCNKCPAYTPCYRGVGTWGANLFPTSAERQRAILDAFEAALPPLDDAPAEAAPREIPQAVRKLVEARIHQLTEQVKALEAERDALCDWLNGVGI